MRDAGFLVDSWRMSSVLPTLPEDVAETRPAVLVVDDAPENLALMSGLLGEVYRVKVATTGEKALRLASSESPPNLILLDVMMPGLDGYEVCQRLKRDPGTAHIPVIFLTSKSDPEDERRGLELGAVDYITKPISPPIVMARVRNHLALQALTDSLRVRNLQVEAASRMKSGFLANMSQQLRPPLKAIIGASESLKAGPDGEIGPRQKERASQIFTSGRDLLAVIDDILDLSRVEEGTTLTLEPLNVAELIQSGLQAVREEAAARRQNLGTLVPEDLGDIWVDGRKVRQILKNLLSNAVKFTQAGGDVRVEARRVLRAIPPEGREGPHLEFVVRDNGIGISAADQASIFEPFSQIDGTPTRGNGLGLAMVKRMTDLHGGSVAVRSAPARGSAFTVWLPWRADGSTRLE